MASERRITLRPATMTDWPILLSWRNDVQTRESFINSKPISQAEHVDWLRKTVASSDHALFIASDAISNCLVGTCRLDLRHPVPGEPVTCDISITVAPEKRGGRYAAPMIEAAVSAPPRAWQLERVVATIRTSNEASSRAFQSAGFSLVSRDHDYLTLAKAI